MDCAAYYNDWVAKVRNGYPITIAWNAVSQSACSNYQPIYARFMADTSTPSSDPNASVLAFEAAFPSVSLAPIPTPSPTLLTEAGPTMNGNGYLPPLTPSDLNILNVIKTGLTGALGGTGTTNPVNPLVGSACNLLPAGALRDACLAAGNSLTGGGTTSAITSTGTCPPGQKWNATKGVCETEGLTGTVQRFFPGGETGTLADVGGGATVGAWGKPARYPMQVGTITRNDGVVMPILRCPRGERLGEDNLCYVKGTAGVVWKWRRPPRPPISRKDWRALKSLERVQRVTGELAKQAGWHVYKTARSGARKRK